MESNKIILTLVSLLVAGQAYLFYAVLWQDATLPSAQQDSSPTTWGAEGVVENIKGDIMTLQTAQGSLSIRISDARVTVRGVSKGGEDFNQELEVYNARLIELKKDPTANREEIEFMIYPSVYQESAIDAFELRAGDRVQVQAREKKGDTYVASYVTKLPPQ